MFRIILQASFIFVFLTTSSFAENANEPAATPTPVPTPGFELKKFDGAELFNHAEAKYDSYTLRAPKPAPNEELKVYGAVRRLLYRVNGTTPVEVMQNYRAQLEEEGFREILFEDKYSWLHERWFCNQTLPICNRGGIAMGTLFHVGNADGFQYLSSQKDLPEKTIYVIVEAARLKQNFKLLASGGKTLPGSAGETIVGVDVIETKPLVKNMVKETASFIEEALSKNGRVNLYGIYFDFDKADLKPESDATLSQIAEVLRKDPGLRLSVVGHTDSVGTPEYNQKLSEGRAKAVVDDLVNTRGIELQRLKSLGKGATEPVESNETDVGRAKNRRVELIKEGGNYSVDLR